MLKCKSVAEQLVDGESEIRENYVDYPNSCLQLAALFLMSEILVVGQISDVVIEFEKSLITMKMECQLMVSFLSE